MITSSKKSYPIITEIKIETQFFLKIFEALRFDEFLETARKTFVF